MILDLLYDTWPAWKFSESHHKARLLLETLDDRFVDFPDLEDPTIFEVALIEAYQGRNINMGGDLRARDWLRMFRYCGFVSDGPSPPAGPLTVYRGAAPVWRKTGPAWTTDLDVACWFANRHPEGAVWRAVVEPRHVLGLLDDSDEHEVIVSPFAPPIRAATAVLRMWRPDEGYRRGCSTYRCSLRGPQR